MLVKCLSCDVENDALATSGFCDHCGKKLPTSAMVRTRRAIDAGSDGEEPAAARQREPVAEGLFASAVVQLIAGGLFLVLGPTMLRAVPETFLPLCVVLTVVPAALLGVAGVIAGRRPRAAVVAALVGYLVWAVAAFAWQPAVGLAWLVVHLIMAGPLGWVAWVGRTSS